MIALIFTLMFGVILLALAGQHRAALLLLAGNLVISLLTLWHLMTDKLSVTF